MSPSLIITLCGSARFERHFKAWNEVLTLAGHTVFSLAVYPSDKGFVKEWYNPVEKARLDAAHRQKIEASQAILVLNVGGYIGRSTRDQLLHARHCHRRIFASDFKHNIATFTDASLEGLTEDTVNAIESADELLCHEGEAMHNTLRNRLSALLA